jgi:hypothetical protein
VEPEHPTPVAENAPVTSEPPNQEPPKPEPSAIETRLQEPYVEVLPETISGSRWEHIIGTLPVLRRFKKQELTPPVATYEVNPLASVDRRSVTRSPFVDIKVSVSEAGKVVFAEVTKYGDPPNLDLANAALSAAKRWIFKPAVNASTQVSSEIVLHFHFVP